MDIILSKEEKINLIKLRIDSISFHIPILEKNILEDPFGDVNGKPTRQSVLNDFKSRLASLQGELDKVSLE
jgi:hypothetical protein